MRSFFLFFVSIFLATAAFAQVPATIPVSTQAKGYVLWPGDEVTGKVLGEPDFDFVATVNEDGNIEVPFFDKPIKAQCRTERDLRSDVTLLLQKYLKQPQLSLRVTDRKSRPPATISGEVNAPQQVTLFRKVTLLEMLSVAGGVKDEAGGTIQVFRTQPPICSEDVEGSNWKVAEADTSGVPSRIYNIGSVKVADKESNPIIYPGDVIMVQRASPVYITGEVNNPQGVYIKEGGLTLGEAIAKIGGPRREAKTKDIKIYRRKANSSDREVISANYDLIRKGQQKDIQLEPYDIIEVDKSKDSLAVSIMKIALGAGKSTISAATSGIGYRIMY